MEQQHLLKQRERADSTVSFQASLSRATDALAQVVGLAPTSRPRFCTHDLSPPDSFGGCVGFATEFDFSTEK
jgi:hypothetical protein